MLKGAELLSRTRKFSDDTVQPYSNSDSLLYSYITEAQRELAAHGKLLRAVVNYPVLADARWVQLGEEPEIHELRSAILIDEDGRRSIMQLLGTMDQPTSFMNDYHMLIEQSPLKPGRPQKLIFGKSTGMCELSPPADKPYTIEASVVAYPTDPISSASDEPQIAERYHASIPIGAALKAVETTDFYDLSSAKLNSLTAAWEKALERARIESGAISRDASVVRFTNDFW